MSADDWRAGDIVEALGELGQRIRVWELTPSDAADLALGENPMHPWRVALFRRLVPERTGEEPPGDE